MAGSDLDDGTALDDPLRFLRERRSMTKASDEPVPRELVEQIIEAATWAPNHRRTEPWRFVVLEREARLRLGGVMAQALLDRLARQGVVAGTEQLDKERVKPLRAPVIIAVAAVPSPDPKVIEIEEIAATAGAVQNMLLAAQALGLRAMWRTGDAAYDATVKLHLGLPESSHLVAFVYLGYPEIIPPGGRPGDAASKTVWVDR